MTTISTDTGFTIIEACDDCVNWLIDGTAPDDRPDLGAAIFAIWPDACWIDVAGGTEPWFCWRACECCGSTLGGMREHVVVQPRPVCV